MKQKSLLTEYITQKKSYEGLTKTIASLVKILLEDSKINYQKIEYRTKGVRSLENKIYQKNIQKKKYKKLDDITDLSGIRIIVFFKDDIAKVVNLIENEFKIHQEESVGIDLNVAQKPREFGYQSEHRIISINQNRSKLKEYKIFHNLKCEIQIRTVLQHAWAEIEHDIGYKSEIKEIEKKRIELTRMFSQNAALLEVADDNFVKIRKLYENMIQQYRVSITEHNFNIPLNLDSVREYFNQYPQSQDIYKNLETKNIEASEELKKARHNKITNLNNFDKSLKRVK